MKLNSISGLINKSGLAVAAAALICTVYWVHLSACSDTGDGVAVNAIEAPSLATAPAVAAAGKQQGLKMSGKVSAPFDVKAVMKQVHFAFRPDKRGGFEGGHVTYGARVGAGGRLSVTPYHFPQTRQDGKQRSARYDVSGRKPGRPKKEKGIEGAPLVLETGSITRGTGRLATRLGAARVEDRGQYALSRGQGITERLVNGEDGVEQSWTFQSPPSGSGDLVVRVKVSGQAYAGTTANGLHFVDAKTKIGARYGWATWVDATGKRTEVRGRFEAGAIVMAVPAKVIDAAAYPAVLDPVVTAEFGMDNPVSGPAQQNQRHAAVAFDGNNYLVVWDDHRPGNNDDLYGARVNPSGMVLDKMGFAISSAIDDQIYPTVAYGGGNFLVVWQDHRFHSTYSDIYAARVDKTGKVLDKNGIAISTAYLYQYTPKVAFDGKQFLVVWADYRDYKNTGWDIYGSRVDTKGTVLDTKGIAISIGGEYETAPNLAFDGTNYLVAWQDYRNATTKANYSDIYGARVATSGKVLDAKGFAISTAAYNQNSPSLAYGGGTYFVAWDDYRDNGLEADIYGARVTTSGALTDKKGIIISEAKEDQDTTAVAYGGGLFTVIWQDWRTGSYSDIYGARVSTTGVLQDKTGIAISKGTNNEYAPAIIYAGSKYFIVWEDYQDSSFSGSNVMGVFMTGGKVGAVYVEISLSANIQTAPDVAYDGTNYLVVWGDRRNYKLTYWDIYGAIVDPKGKCLTPSGIAMTKAKSHQYYRHSTSGSARGPVVAYGSGYYLVVWEDWRSSSHGDIYGTLVDTKGVVQHPQGIPINTATYYQWYPSVAFNGTHFLVVWQTYHNYKTSGYDIHGTLVNKLGGVLSGSGIVICNNTTHQYYPSVATDGKDFLVTWYDYRNYASNNYDIYGTVVSSTGTVKTTAGFPISTAVYNQYYPEVAFDGTNYLVVWQDYRNYTTSYWDIYGSRVSKTGTVLDPKGMAISVNADHQMYPHLAFTGSYYLVAWQDYRGGSYNADIYATQVSASGKVLDKQGFPVSTSITNEKSPRVVVGKAPNGSTGYLVTYSKFDTSTTQGCDRVKARFITGKSANGIPCKLGTACESGYCIDGVCCDTACGGGNATDCQACSITFGAQKDGVCAAVIKGKVCRASSGPCDAVEACDGKATTCPTNSYKPTTAICRAALGPCDVPEYCDGAAAACPNNKVKATGAVCRKTVGKCDLEEKCDGTTVGCPTDTFKSTASVCRLVATVCDVSDNCTGSSPFCPPDKFEGGAKVCRAAAGVCDVEEKCSGASSICPADIFKTAGTKCPGGQCKAGACLNIDAAVADMLSLDSGVDQKVVTPDQKTTTPDQKTTTPDQKVTTPDQKVTSPDQKVTSPDQKVTSPDQKVTTPDQKVATPDMGTVDPNDLDDTGCNCQTGSGGGQGGLSLLGLLLLVLVRRRRA